MGWETLFLSGCFGPKTWDQNTQIEKAFPIPSPSRPQIKYFLFLQEDNLLYPFQVFHPFT